MKRSYIKYKPKRSPIPKEEIAFIKQRSKGICEVLGCGGPAVQIAHLKHRGMGGCHRARAKLINSRFNMFYSCQYHHDLIDRRIKDPAGERSKVLKSLDILLNKGIEF